MIKYNGKDVKIYMVTGGCGFIGSNFIHYMFDTYKDNIFIINIDKLTYAGNPDNLRDIESRGNYVFSKTDICDNEEIEYFFEKYDIDYVVHFAAESHVDRSIKDPEVFIKTNVLGTAVLLNCAKKFWYIDGEFIEGKKFVHISTDEVYGSLPDIKPGERRTYFHECTPYDPHSPYSASKASADMIVKSYIDTYGFPANITNCSNNYGPYQFPEKLIPLVINNIMNDKPIPLYGDGTNVRDWLYVEDHCRAIDCVINKGILGETYNIGGNNEMMNLSIINTIGRVINDILPEKKKLKIEYVKDRLGHDRRYAICSNKIQSQLRWEPEVSFNEGIRKTVQWYLNNKEWVENITSGEYKNYYEEMYKEK